MSCRLLVPAVATCTGTASALRAALGVSGRQLVGSSLAASLDSHVHVCIEGSGVRSQCNAH